MTEMDKLCHYEEIVLVELGFITKKSCELDMVLFK